MIAYRQAQLVVDRDSRMRMYCRASAVRTDDRNATSIQLDSMNGSRSVVPKK